MKATKLELLIPIDDIITIRTIAEVDNPLPIAHACGLLISTFAKQYVVMLYDNDTRDGWIKAIQSQLHNYKQSFSHSYRMKDFNNINNMNNDNYSIGHSYHHIVSDIHQSLFSPIPFKQLSHNEDWILNDKELLNTRNFTSNGIYYQLSKSSLELG